MLVGALGDKFSLAVDFGHANARGRDREIPAVETTPASRIDAAVGAGSWRFSSCPMMELWVGFVRSRHARRIARATWPIP
jgi:hypothetical protein